MSKGKHRHRRTDRPTPAAQREHKRAEHARTVAAELAYAYDDGRGTDSLLNRVREELAAIGGGADVRRRPGYWSAPPGNLEAASYLAEVERGAARLEQLCRRALGFTPCASAGVERSLSALPDLIAALPERSELVDLAVHDLDRWRRRAFRLVGLEQPWRQVDYQCPYCRTYALRRDPSDGVTVCWNPDCVDGTGARPQWTEEELERLVLRIAAGQQAAL